MKHFRHWSCAAIVASVWTVPVHAQSTVYIPDVVELSGPGAVSGTNWRDGAAMAIDEINKSGGILGRKIETEHLDTQSNPGVSRAQIQKVLDRDPYVVLGPIYSGSVKVNMALTQQAEVPQIVGAEAADITQQGNPWVFRTAFGQQFSMPKIANYLHDQLKVKSVAVVWVNNDFGKGGHDSFVKEMKARSIDVVADRICPRSRARSTSDLTSSS
jgi:branched-chain amino acid transport system substrate-binding protein